MKEIINIKTDIDSRSGEIKGIVQHIDIAGAKETIAALLGLREVVGTLWEKYQQIMDKEKFARILLDQDCPEMAGMYEKEVKDLR